MQNAAPVPASAPGPMQQTAPAPPLRQLAAGSPSSALMAHDAPPAPAPPPAPQGKLSPVIHPLHLLVRYIHFISKTACTENGNMSLLKAQ